MSERTPGTAIPQPLQPVLHQLLEAARAMIPGGTTDTHVELSSGGLAIATASQLANSADESYRVVLFGCAEELLAADQRVLDVELRRLQRSARAPMGEPVTFQWLDNSLQPYTGGLPLPSC